MATTNIEGRVSNRVQMVTGPWIFSALAVLNDLVAGGASAAREEDGLAHLRDAFVPAVLACVPTADGRRAVPPLVEPLLRTVGSVERVLGAFGDVTVDSSEAIADRVVLPEDELPYKRGETHWINWQSRGRPIFR